MNTKITEKDGRILLNVSGELDTLAAASFQEDVEPLMKRSSEGLNVEVDLSELNYIASKGLRVFLMFHQEITSHGGSVKVTNVTDTVKEVFELTGFSKIFF